MQHAPGNLGQTCGYVAWSRPRIDALLARFRQHLSFSRNNSRLPPACFFGLWPRFFWRCLFFLPIKDRLTSLYCHSFSFQESAILANSFKNSFRSKGLSEGAFFIRSCLKSRCGFEIKLVLQLELLSPIQPVSFEDSVSF